MIPPELHAAIQRIVTYNWSDERADFYEQDAQGQDGHVFTDLCRVQAELDRGELRADG